MHNFTLKNIPENLYKRIKTAAQENRRSMNSEILTRLDHSLKSARIDLDVFIQDLENFQQTLQIPPLTDELLHQAKKNGRT